MKSKREYFRIHSARGLLLFPFCVQLIFYTMVLTSLVLCGNHENSAEVSWREVKMSRVMGGTRLMYKWCGRRTWFGFGRFLLFYLKCIHLIVCHTSRVQDPRSELQILSAISPVKILHVNNLPKMHDWVHNHLLIMNTKN